MSAYAGVREGDIIAGKYRIDRVLGAGAMGVVVAAHHLKLDERVAIKFLQPEALANAEAVIRFEREARAAVRIKSEHVARVLDVGALENGAPYMVMEHLEGGDLAAWLQQKGPLAVDQAVEFVLQALEAIAEAHRLGIVHRDLKPANLFVVRRADGLDAVKVLDFGISKLSLAGEASLIASKEKLSGDEAQREHGVLQHESMSMTRTAMAMGSPFYMSPEQIQSACDVDVRTDIWSMGITLWELVTGKVPFGGTTIQELCMRICASPLPTLGEKFVGAPASLERVLARCLEKDRRKRYANVAELAVALRDFAPKRAQASVERIVRTISTSSSSTLAVEIASSSDVSRSGDAGTSMAPFGRTASGVKRGSSKAGPIAIAGALMVVSAVAAVKLWNRQPTTGAPALAGSGQASPSLVVAREGEPRSAPDDAIVTEAVSARSFDAAAAASSPRTSTATPASAARRPSVASAPVKPLGVPSVKPQGLDCDPPFTFDDKGRKHFKPECYR